MPAVSLTEAARLVGVSRKTIQRRVSDGVLSVSIPVHGNVQGEKFVEISELIRVFGELPGQPAVDTVQANGQDMSQPVQNHVPRVVQALEAKIDGMTALIEAKDAAIEILTGQVDELREEKRELRAQVAGLLEDRRKPAPVRQTPVQPPVRTPVHTPQERDWAPLVWLGVGIPVLCICCAYVWSILR